MCTMKQVGLNVASDPLMSLAYIGVKGGMVVAVADDPGPWSSQTEQDTRNFAKHANLPVFDPSSPEEAYEMIQTAFDFSEKFELPVFLRPTTRVCHASAEVELREPSPVKEAGGFERRPEWCIFPALSYRKHGELEVKQHEMSYRKHGELEVKQHEMARAFDAMPYNRIETYGAGSRRAVAASGISYLYAKEALNELDPSFNLGDCRIQLGRVEDNNVNEVFESSKRLNEINLSDLTVFVLPPEGCYLGKPAHEQYLRSAVIHKIEKDQVYKLLIKGPNGLPLTGKVTEIYTDFRFRVACSDSQVRQMMITEFADREQYMLRPGDYVYVERLH